MTMMATRADFERAMAEAEDAKRDAQRAAELASKAVVEMAKLMNQMARMRADTDEMLKDMLTLARKEDSDGNSTNDKS